MKVLIMNAEPSPLALAADELEPEPMAQFAEALCQQMLVHRSLSSNPSQVADLQAFLETSLAIVARHLNLMTDP